MNTGVISMENIIHYYSHMWPSVNLMIWISQVGFRSFMLQEESARNIVGFFTQ